MEKGQGHHSELLEIQVKLGAAPYPVFPVSKKRITLGRSPYCDIIVNHPEVSSIHAVLEIKDKIIIYDMNSRNGTTVKGKSIVDEKLEVGSSFKLATVELELRVFEGVNQTPPELDILAPLPPIIEGSRADIKLEKNPAPQQENAFIEKAMKLPSAPSSQSRVLYPLASDPKADYSEYIFEEEEKLYPIFKYTVDKAAVEIIIVHQDRIFSVDYLPEKPGSYFLSGSAGGAKDIEFPYLLKEEKVPFVEVSKGSTIIHELPGYDSLYFSDGSPEKKEKIPSQTWYLREGEILRFSSQDIQIFVRSTEKPPKIKVPPFFRRDRQFQSILLLCFALILLFLLGINIYEVDEELEKEKTPKYIATILYKPKRLTVARQDNPVKTKKAPKRLQKAPKKPEKPVTKKTTKKTPKNIVRKKSQPKKAGSKAAVKKTDQRKKATPKKSAPARKSKKVAKSSRSQSPKRGGKSQTRATKKNFAPNPSNSKGRVDAFRSQNLSSTLNKILAKGGSTKGVRAQTQSDSSVGLTDISGGGAEGGVKRAKVSTNIGSLTGASVGRLEESQGAEGLVNKSKTYVAGIPSETVIFGSMDPDLIRRILRDNLRFFRHCYQKELDRSTREFQGVLTLDFVIGASGRVVNAGVEGASSLPPKVRGCVVNVLRGIRFPQPKAGGQVQVRQPLNFYPVLK